MPKDENDDQKRSKKRGRKRRVVMVVGIGLLAAAVVQELRKPVEERTWTGRVGGLVPYDLRWPPTVERFQAAWWNPDLDVIFTPHPFGVGWSVNVAKVAEIAQEALDAP